MARYAVVPATPTKSVKSSGAYLRVHFKNTRETACALSGMNLKKAYAYLDAVKEHQRCIPFTRFNGSIGRTGQASEFGHTRGRWPVKSIHFIEGLLKNAEANAQAKNLDVDKLEISHIQVNRAPKQRRRTYRAHGRVNPYMSSPSHIEVILTEKPEDVPKAAEEKKTVKLTTRRAAKLRI